jgi:hypothetical protein
VAEAAKRLFDEVQAWRLQKEKEIICHADAVDLTSSIPKRSSREQNLSIWVE